MAPRPHLDNSGPLGVRSVSVDAEHHLTVVFTHPMVSSEWTPARFKVHSTSGRALRVKAVYPFQGAGRCVRVFSIRVAERLEAVRERYDVEVDGLGRHRARVGFLLNGADRYADASAVLGADCHEACTEFRVFAPGADAARVIISDELFGDVGRREFTMQASDAGIWHARVEGDWHGKCYAYSLAGAGFHAEHELTDPYAVCMQARHTRARIVKLADTDPAGFRDYAGIECASPADAVIYELHVRDFTHSPRSGVSHKGSYLGLTEQGATLPGEPAIKTGLDHLTELGVTHVQLLPVMDFDNAENKLDTYRWGYMPVNFFSPDGWYASSAVGDARIRELKSAIAAIHDRGMGVILDVVFNHTSHRAMLRRFVPGYYYRRKPGGGYSNGSGCGNEIRTENPMVRKLIVDACCFWAREYLVDGFRFDIMGLIDLDTMLAVRRRLSEVRPGILVYGEPWVAGPTPLKPITDKQRVCGTGIGAFNDHFRDAIKGQPDDASPGFVQCGARRDAIMAGLRGGVGDWARDPVDSINYCECHDNLTTWDKLLISAPKASDEDRRSMMRLAGLILLTSQGSVFLHGGQDFCRGKGGAHNSYNLPDEINQIDWLRKKQFHDVFEYYQALIALRKAHPALRLRTGEETQRRISFADPPGDRTVVYSIDARDMDSEPAEEIRVLLNGGDQSATFGLPGGLWSVRANATQASTDPIDQIKKEVTLLPHSGMLLICSATSQ